MNELTKTNFSLEGSTKYMLRADFYDKYFASCQNFLLPLFPLKNLKKQVSSVNPS